MATSASGVGFWTRGPSEPAGKPWFLPGIRAPWKGLKKQNGAPSWIWLYKPRQSQAGNVISLCLNFPFCKMRILAGARGAWRWDVTIPLPGGTCPQG